MIDDADKHSSADPLQLIRLAESTVPYLCFYWFTIRIIIWNLSTNKK
jgi:hypothetical protein